GFKAKFAGTPMVRTKRRGLLRNVCVALGNIGDRAALPALERATQDHEPLVAEHARWAVEQIRVRANSSSHSSQPESEESPAIKPPNNAQALRISAPGAQDVERT